MTSQRLIETLVNFSDDPFGFVLFNYPWGEPGPLEAWKGPQDWQGEILTDLGKGIISLRESFDLAASTTPLRFARGSGHGIGKSALTAWIIDWAQSTFPDTKGVVTANTEVQLKTKTWAEFTKWHNLSLSKELFRISATSRVSVDKSRINTWRVDIIPWSEKNPQAFAGLHNKGKRLFLLFDESSEIQDVIWETAEGALTDSETEIIWAAFGNPSRSKGYFTEILPGGKFSHRWNTGTIDSRTSTLTNKKVINDWIEDYGIDSNFVRIRVLGKPPSSDEETFFPAQQVEDAIERTHVEQDPEEPAILGVDVGRKNDPSVLYIRKGLDAKSIPPLVIHGEAENFQPKLAQRIVAYAQEHDVAMTFVDTGGMGYGVCDQLSVLGHDFIPIDFGGAPAGVNWRNPMVRYRNRRAEMYGACRDWLPRAMICDNVPGLERTMKEEFLTPNELFYDDTIRVEAKRDIKGRGLPSPNVLDALVLTFALPVERRDPLFRPKPEVSIDWNPFDLELA